MRREKNFVKGFSYMSYICSMLLDITHEYTIIYRHCCSIAIQHKTLFHFEHGKNNFKSFIINGMRSTIHPVHARNGRKMERVDDFRRTSETGSPLH